MLGTYPILIDGEETGALTVRREGIMTVFEARCADPGALLRLSVYGEREGYLGVMMPDGAGGLLLHKRLSRAALAAFPAEIRFAGTAGQGAAVPTPAAAPELPPPPAPEERPTPEPEPALEPAAAPELPEPEEPVTIWRHGAGGALVGALGPKRLLAVPLKSGVAPVGGNFERRRIDGADYAVFEIKNGKII